MWQAIRGQKADYYQQQLDSKSCCNPDVYCPSKSSADGNESTTDSYANRRGKRICNLEISWYDTLTPLCRVSEGDRAASGVSQTNTQARKNMANDC